MMSDDQDVCEWLSVSSVQAYPGSPGPKAVKQRRSQHLEVGHRAQGVWEKLRLFCVFVCRVVNCS